MLDMATRPGDCPLTEGSLAKIICVYVPYSFLNIFEDTTAAGDPSKEN